MATSTWRPARPTRAGCGPSSRRPAGSVCEDEDLRWLDRTETAARVGVAGALGALYTPHCAALHPARLARGLAAAVEAQGVVIHEGTRAKAIQPGRVITDHGTVKAEVVVRATEGFTRSLRGERRTLVPLYSLMIATEPLPDDAWESIGLRQRETFNDARHLIIYGQRTADGRLAFGGRGAPYHFGSAVRPEFDRDADTHTSLHETLRGLFPVIGDAAITHRWGGPLGVARDWTCSVGLDRRHGLAWAGGYVGDGVSTTNLAGRTLADLITGRDTDLTRLPWVGHRSRRWEPEPLRWLGISAGLRLPAGADRAEARTGRPDEPADLGDGTAPRPVGRPRVDQRSGREGTADLEGDALPVDASLGREVEAIPGGVKAGPVISLNRWPTARTKIDTTPFGSMTQISGSSGLPMVPWSSHTNTSPLRTAMLSTPRMYGVGLTVQS